MREKNSLNFIIQQFSQRATQLFVIRAIFRRQKCEPVRLEINQGIAQNQRSATVRVMKHDFARRRPVNANYVKLSADFIAITNSRELIWLFLRKGVTMREYRDAELLRKQSRGALMIRICDNDPCDSGRGHELLESRFVQRNGIEQIRAADGYEASRIKLRFDLRIVSVPDRKLITDGIEVSNRLHEPASAIRLFRSRTLR